MMKDDLKLAIQKALKDENMQKSIQKMHNLFTGNLSIYKDFLHTLISELCT